MLDEEDVFYDVDESPRMGTPLNTCGYDTRQNTSEYDTSAAPCFMTRTPYSSTPEATARGTPRYRPDYREGICDCGATPGRSQGQRRIPQDRADRVMRMAPLRRRLRLDGDSPGAAPAPARDDPLLRVPARFRYVPAYVPVLRAADKDAFWKAVDAFAATERWPPFGHLPPRVQAVCAASDAGACAFIAVPGFAPKWLFLLKPLNEPMFRYAVDFFFQRGRMPLWKHLPATFVKVFELHDIGEFEFPEE